MESEDEIIMDGWNSAWMSAASLPGSVFQVFGRLLPAQAMAEAKKFYFDDSNWFDVMWEQSATLPIVLASVMLNICELVEFMVGADWFLYFVLYVPFF